MSRLAMICLVTALLLSGVLLNDQRANPSMANMFLHELAKLAVITAAVCLFAAWPQRRRSPAPDTAGLRPGVTHPR